MEKIQVPFDDYLLDIQVSVVFNVHSYLVVSSDVLHTHNR